MTTRAVGPLAGIGWLKSAVNLGRHNARALFGGAGLIMVMALLPSAITFPLQLAMKPGPAMVGVIMLFSMVAGILMVPLIGGYLGMIDATENERPAKASDVFAAYRSGGGAMRLIGFGLAMLGVYLVAALVIVGVAGTGIATWYMQLVAQAGKVPPTAMQLPAGFGTAMALGAVFALLFSGVYAIGFGQVALAGRGIRGALGDGFLGSLKNLLPMLVLLIVSLIGGFVVMLAIALVVGLLAFLAKLVSVWLMLVVVVPLYIAIMISLYVVMFGVMYYMWRDVCSISAERPAPTTALTA
ncbi:MAG: hypothetical protein JWL98_1136 [Xanthomonadaceae bacterium]|nr:hypothetical protein [Xanthomonadaceae bacterium]